LSQLNNQTVKYLVYSNQKLIFSDSHIHSFHLDKAEIIVAIEVISYCTYSKKTDKINSNYQRISFIMVIQNLVQHYLSVKSIHGQNDWRYNIINYCSDARFEVLMVVKIGVGFFCVVMLGSVV